MRMKLKEVFAAFTHVSFLETIDSSKEMELHVEVEDMDEKPVSYTHLTLPTN